MRRTLQHLLRFCPVRSAARAWRRPHGARAPFQATGFAPALLVSDVRGPADTLAGVGGQIALLWTGLELGVAFVATPAKFLAPSISLPVALDVGRQTFMVANRVELGICLIVLLAAALTRRRRAWTLAFAPPALAVLLQTIWLIPALDARVGLILAGQSPPPSPLHGLYVGLELGKATWLALAGLSMWPWRQERAGGLARAPRLGGEMGWPRGRP